MVECFFLLFLWKFGFFYVQLKVSVFQQKSFVKLVLLRSEFEFLYLYVKWCVLLRDFRCTGCREQSCAEVFIYFSMKTFSEFHEIFTVDTFTLLNHDVKFWNLYVHCSSSYKRWKFCSYANGRANRAPTTQVQNSLTCAYTCKTCASIRRSSK